MRCCIQTSLLNSSNANFVWILTLRHTVGCPFCDTVKTPAEFVLHDFFRRGGGVVITLHFIISKLLICGNIYSRNQCKTKNQCNFSPTLDFSACRSQNAFHSENEKKIECKEIGGVVLSRQAKGSKTFPSPTPNRPLFTPPYKPRAITSVQFSSRLGNWQQIKMAALTCAQILLAIGMLISGSINTLSKKAQNDCS